MKTLRFCLLAWVLISSFETSAKIRLPQNLSQSDRQKALEILGFGTSGKVLSDPYPLGGYSGFEVALSIESVPVDDLGRLGGKTEPNDRFTYPKISIGKGLFYDIDFFVHFIPFNESTGLSEFGGILRWSFYQATFLPATISLVAHANNANVNNQYSGLSSGVEIITGLNVKNFSLFLGAGKVHTYGRFIGGANGVTDSGRVEFESAQTLHSIIGGSYRMNQLFAAFQIDQYTQPVFSTKVGLKF
jgi:hypothetical protein